MSRAVQYVILGSTDVRAELLLSIDRVARELDDEPGWRIQVEVDPGTVVIATPARDIPPAETPSEAPLAPEDGEDG